MSDIRESQWLFHYTISLESLANLTNFTGLLLRFLSTFMQTSHGKKEE